MLLMLFWMGQMQFFLVLKLFVDYTLLSAFPLWEKFVPRQRKCLTKTCTSRRLLSLLGSPCHIWNRLLPQRYFIIRCYITVFSFSCSLQLYLFSLFLIW
nr:hypothetical protein Iba_chr04dCG9530 [Ipomoea batatas]GMC90463.1 hypothetical protein Iba_chr04fCG8330 [Ipomoea batatas]